MKTLKKIAFYQNRRDEIPNQELAAQLAKTENKKGIAEIAANLNNKNKNIQSDCLKVLYEIGYRRPDLIAMYADAFLDLLSSKNNRMVWGAMIGLGTTSSLKSKEIWNRVADVVTATEEGSLISFIWGIKTLSQVAAKKEQDADYIVPRLKRYFKKCNPRDVPSHLESMVPAITKENKESFIRIAETRKAEMTSSQLTRLRKVIRTLDT
jgi:hypothetical protein